MSEITPEMLKKAQAVIQENGLDITIHDDGTFSGPPDDYFRFINALAPEGELHPAVEDFISFLARKAVREYYESGLKRMAAEKP